jgi:hypothetical protein
MGSFGTCCCEPPSGPTMVRTHTHIYRQQGFPPLIETLDVVSGRYIAPGWTGVSPQFAAGPHFGLSDWRIIDAIPDSDDIALMWHYGGEVVRRRSGADGGTLQYYIHPAAVHAGHQEPDRRAVTTLPGTFGPDPFDPDWVLTAAAAFVNTYIVNGFWRGGTANFTRGQLIYRCTPDAQETNDDWAITPYLCIADVIAAGDPATDQVHFANLIDGGQGDQIFQNQLQEPLLRDNFAPIPAGYINGGRRALRDLGLSEPIDSSNVETFNVNRPQFTGLPEPVGANCQPPPRERWLSLEHRTELNGSEFSAPAKVTTCGIATEPPNVAGTLAQAFTPMDDIFPAPAAPAVGGVVTAYTADFVGSTLTFSGGSFTANASNFAPALLLAGQKISIRRIVRNVPAGPIISDVTTEYVTVQPRTYAEPYPVWNAGAGQYTDYAIPVGHFANNITSFEVVPRTGRLAYPAVPGLFNDGPDDVTNPYATIVRAIRLTAAEFTKTQAQFSWRILISPYALRAKAGAVVTDHRERLYSMELIQRVRLEAPDTLAAAAGRTPITVEAWRTVTRQPAGNATIQCGGGGGPGTSPGIGGTSVRITWDELQLHGPQTARLQTRLCSGVSVCQNIAVGSGGRVYTMPNTDCGANIQLVENSTCV